MPGGGHFWLVVSSGGLPYLYWQCALGDGEGSPPLSFSNAQFRICGVCCHLRSCGFCPVLGVTLHIVLAPQFIARSNSLVPELLSGPSQIQCSHGSYLVPFCLQLFLSKYCTEIVYADIRSCGRSWQRGYGSVSSPLSLIAADWGGDPGVLYFRSSCCSVPLQLLWSGLRSFMRLGLAE